ncbi:MULTISPECIES: ABC-2 family transporter protein [unclassified Lactobacillus]|uniref:ABC-2 family transporter protein n=1 Tax=unclassified Lactobacillus TaxID=2620435 RepID=UPI000EFC70A9|nr:MULTISPECIES: ABC-2 family transporter protein [unclassified Lactobacillus]RMC26308.1 ABC transporter permease [Lactobacillus sp. ESL0247]RMC29846.1 ABC transporter permease [Lactobacillus sp. ESL0246]RMC34503.1 ABC transporter permease [Lactobacillus sp. ESL0245]RMC52077.1 ABC transporter permease [Lactobacillus sp. ESL0228]
MIRIVKTIWKTSIEEFLIYRTTSIITFILALIFLIIELVTGDIYFADDRSIPGWTENQYFILITFVNCSTYIYNIFFILGHEELNDDILEGNLDYVLVRPISSYWLSVGKSIDIPSIFNFIITYILLIVFLNKEAITQFQFIVINILIIATALMIFVLNQICLTLLFWFNGLVGLGGVIEDLFNFASRPKKIFPKIIQNIFVFVIPILLATNITNEFLKYGIQSYFIYYLILLVIFYVISKFLWKLGIKKYVSAN